METPPPKQYILPFSDPKKSARSLEAAAFYALAESNRGRGGGLLSRQPQENIVFIAKIGYPLWIFPQDGLILTFNGLDDSTYDLPYFEEPSASTFMRNLQENSQPKEKYVQFLTSYMDYFDVPSVPQQFTLKGLLASLDFKVDFITYLKEATEKTGTIPTLQPKLEFATITASLAKLTRLQTCLKDDAEMLPQILDATNKVTNQYLQEFDFKITASKEESDAKIKALEEFIKPKVAKLTKETKARAREINKKYYEEIAAQEKQRRKTQKAIAKTESEIRLCEVEAKRHAKRGHEIYERRWKEKARAAQKMLSAYKKMFRDLESNIRKLSRDMGQEIFQLNSELAEKTLHMQKPILALGEEYASKMLEFKQQASRLATLQKNLAERISRSIKQRETATLRFNDLGIDNFAFELPSLVYVPFYVVCYIADTGRRYVCYAPSTVEDMDLSAKFKGVFGRSKIKDLLTPRFSSLVGLIGYVEAYSRRNRVFELQLFDLGVKNNLLSNAVAVTDIKEGLAELRERGWLTEKETADLASRFAV